MRGFVDMVKEGHIKPHVLNQDEISDRSKVDSLGKLLGCVQALWMIVNLIVRKASGLPLTLIGLNVAVHVVVAVVVYGLWWHKPMAVARPIFLSTETDPGDAEGPVTKVALENSAPEIFIVSYIAQGLIERCFSDADRIQLKDINDSITEGQLPMGKVIILDKYHQNLEHVSGYQPATSKVSELGILNSCEGSIVLDQPSGITLTRGQTLVWIQLHFALSVDTDTASFGFIPNKMLERLKVVLGYLRDKIPKSHQIQIQRSSETYSKQFLHSPPNIIVQGHVTTGRGMENETMLYIAVVLLSCIYAGCHASAWNSHFPSFLERWFWRGSCILIPLMSVVAIGSILAVYFIALNIDSDFLEILFLCILGFSAAMYSLARAFIVVKAFISVRSLPLGAYDTVDWVGLWPYF